MRFLLCLLIWVVFIGGLFLYTSGRQGPVSQTVVAAPAPPQTQQRIALELTPTFSLEEDPFALQTAEKKEPFELRLNGEQIKTAAADLSRGKTLLLSDIGGVRDDYNEIFVKASPPIAESTLAHGIRVRLLHGDQVLADKTIWSSGGGLVSGSVSFTLKDTADNTDGH